MRLPVSVEKKCKEVARVKRVAELRTGNRISFFVKHSQRLYTVCMDYYEYGCLGGWELKINYICWWLLLEDFDAAHGLLAYYMCHSYYKVCLLQAHNIYAGD